MGWFWADSPTRRTAPGPIAPHPRPNDIASPPPGCPKHTAEAPPATYPPQLANSTSTPSSCPVKSPSHPIRYPTSPSQPQSDPRPSSSSTFSKLNPLNYMPTLSNTRESIVQTTTLPLSRETSTIPRGDADSNWEYPSPQQMYNAMLRKGYTDTPIDAVESMVAVHNFLNEGAWNEIVEWEQIFGKGLGHGWGVCSKGEQGIAFERAKREYLKQRREALGVNSSPPSDPDPQPKLLRFMGRPGDRTPKARMLQVMSWMFPDSYGTEPPFDRHDWYIARQTPSGATKEVRYVIDYYSDGTQETGEPVFYLDIRPALDTPTAAMERAMRWGGDVWYRASGKGVAKAPNES